MHTNAPTPVHRRRGADHPRRETAAGPAHPLRDDGVARKPIRYRRRPVSAHWDRRPSRQRWPVTRALSRWHWRGSVALLAVCLAFFIYPLLPNDDVINSDWPAFATGARLIVSDPGHLYDLDVQQRVERDVTGGRGPVTPRVHGIFPFPAPARGALLARPVQALGAHRRGRAR